MAKLKKYYKKIDKKLGKHQRKIDKVREKWEGREYISEYNTKKYEKKRKKYQKKLGKLRAKMEKKKIGMPTGYWDKDYSKEYAKDKV